MQIEVSMYMSLVLLWFNHSTVANTIGEVQKKLDPAANEIFYNSGNYLHFSCQEHPTKPRKVNWYLNGLELTKQNVPELRTWRVEQMKEGQPYYKGNNMTLYALNVIFKRTSDTLFCKVKGRYSDNVVKVFNLVRNIERLPAGPILGKHGVRQNKQTCPLYNSINLTLTCSEAIKYLHISGWIWRQDGKTIPGAGTSELTVTEQGNYECWYQTHSQNEKLLVEFQVIDSRRRKRKNSQSEWAFCRYTRSNQKKNGFRSEKHS